VRGTDQILPQRVMADKHRACSIGQLAREPPLGLSAALSSPL
jgi:hypothetical protein